ncbi:MAG: hypothetical protein WCP89_01465 [archaeon]
MSLVKVAKIVPVIGNSGKDCLIEVRPDLSDLAIGDLIEVEGKKIERVYHLGAHGNSIADSYFNITALGNFSTSHHFDYIPYSEYNARMGHLMTGELNQWGWLHVRRGGSVHSSKKYQIEEARMFDRFDEFLRKYDGRVAPQIIIPPKGWVRKTLRVFGMGRSAVAS